MADDFKKLTPVQKLHRVVERLDLFAWKRKAEGSEHDFAEIIEIEGMIHATRAEMIAKNLAALIGEGL